MSSMWKSLTLIALIGSLLYGAGGAEETIVKYVRGKLSQNPAVHINSIKVDDKLPIEGVKGWSAYVVTVDLNLTRGKQTRHINFDDILFVSRDLIAPELFDRKTGRDLRRLIKPNMPKDIYSEAHLLFGNPDAKHKIVVFSDPLCPFCRMSVPGIFKAAKEHPEDIALYYYHLPLLGLHPASGTLVRVMEAARKEGRKDVIEKMYSMKIDANLQDEKKILSIVEKETGYKVTPKQIHQKWIDEKLDHDKKTAKQLLVSGTPTVFADGQKDVTREKYKTFISKKK